MSKIFSALFLLSFLAYIVFATIEEFVFGFVSDYFNPHWLLIPVVVFLVLTLTVERAGKRVQDKKDVRGSIPLIIIATFATLILLLLGARELPIFWRILVAIYGAVLVAGILTVLFKE